MPRPGGLVADLKQAAHIRLRSDGAKTTLQTAASQQHAVKVILAIVARTYVHRCLRVSLEQQPREVLEALERRAAILTIRTAFVAHAILAAWLPPWCPYWCLT